MKYLTLALTLSACAGTALPPTPVKAPTRIETPGQVIIVEDAIHSACVRVTDQSADVCTAVCDAAKAVLVDISCECLPVTDIALFGECKMLEVPE